MDSLYKKIKERRKYLKITQSDLAEMSEVSLRTIKAIENNKSNPTLCTMEQLLRPLGLTITAVNR
ncbi:MAG: helix-turn-helix domain-containing protein [Fibrobacteria bacterium]|nr:helix-turn-helix domain-containing protein [Fibrobacteria bacterium]